MKKLLRKIKGAMESIMVYFTGYKRGKADEQDKQRKKDIQDVLQTQKRRGRRLRDSDDVVVKRMRRYTRSDK